MTTKEFSKTIASTCKQRMKQRNFRYVDIEINYALPAISVGMNGCEFFAQGESAQELIEEAVNTSNKTQLAVTTCLIWQLESAGIWSN